MLVEVDVGQGDLIEFTITEARIAHDHNCEVDGEAGKETITALEALLTDDITVTGSSVLISGDNCYVRSEPNTSGKKLDVAYADTRLSYAEETSPEGWLKVAFNNRTGWVSSKYGKVE